MTTGVLTEHKLTLNRVRTGKKGVTFSDESVTSKSEYLFIEHSTYEELGRPSKVEVTIKGT